MLVSEYQLQLPDKRIIPFVTSGGSGLGRSVDDIRKICVGAEVLEGGAFLGHQVAGKFENGVFSHKSQRLMQC